MTSISRTQTPVFTAQTTQTTTTTVVEPLGVNGGRGQSGGTGTPPGPDYGTWKTPPLYTMKEAHSCDDETKEKRIKYLTCSVERCKRQGRFEGKCGAHSDVKRPRCPVIGCRYRLRLDGQCSIHLHMNGSKVVKVVKAVTVIRKVRIPQRCATKGCVLVARVAHMCARHSLEAPRKPPGRSRRVPCIVEGCEHQGRFGRLCGSHSFEATGVKVDVRKPRTLPLADDDDACVACDEEVNEIVTRGEESLARPLFAKLLFVIEEELRAERRAWEAPSFRGACGA